MKTPFRSRASSDDVDILDSEEWIHLKRGIDCRGCGPIGLHRHLIMLCGRVRPPSGESGGIEIEVGPREGRPGRCRKSSADDLVLGSGLCPWSPTMALNVSMNSGVEVALMEIVLERDPIPLIDLSDSETVEGLVAQGVEPRVSLEEDPSEAEFDTGMLPELKGAAPVATEGIDTFVEAASQQMARLREEISRMDAFCYTARQAHRQARGRFFSTTGDIVDRASAELESWPGDSACQYHPQNGKGLVVQSFRSSGTQEPTIDLERFPRIIKKGVHTSVRKAAIGSAANSYKRPGQGLWKSRDSKRSRGEHRIGMCTYCCRGGHMANMCYGKLRLCFQYGKSGHTKDQCPETQQVPPEEQADLQLGEEPQKE
ncbi:hypothetical protein M9H77_24128 [Catharanthus roseus]|uniref:Uncharacterized protein n=1 Tax=Catharanthus roseus TaxID=4058 RepID=A0ACC0AWZ7_CATRO|nr:hypothetical protein M9H77_24128 [Catharanthus roseus]